MLQGIGTWEILLIFLVALLLFGAKRIPEIAKGLGKGITEFKRAVRDVKDEIETSAESAGAAQSPTPPANETKAEPQAKSE